MRRPLLEFEILEAQDNSKSAAAAARYLGVCFNTYKKYAKLYGIYERLKNPHGKGIKKSYNVRRGKYSLDDILAGKYLKYDLKMLRKRLIHNLYIEERCAICGFDEARISDMRVPLLLDFIDDDKLNFNLENLRLLCFNCYHLNVGECVSRRFKG